MNNDITPLPEGQPRASRKGGIRGGSTKTRFYRDQLKSNPGKWFVWKAKSPYASDSGGALRTLVGVQSLSGMDRSTLDYEATSQKQEDGTYTTFVRYRGERSDLVDNEFTPLAERFVQTEKRNDVVTNPFGANA